MTLFKAIFLATIVIVAGCRKDVRSRSKSIVGLEADLDPTILKGEAPSFLQLQKWFQGELPVSSEKAQVGHINYQVHSDFSESTVSNLPQEYRDKIIAYLVQQGQRVADFQSNLKNPQKLNALLKSEADEMEDILTALVVVGYKPRTNDLLAHLVAHPPLRNFIDRYSVELLEQLYKRSQRSLIAGLPKEAENFANLMSKTYIGTNGANDKFISGLKNNCAKIQNMLASLKVSKSVPCNGAEGMNLTTTPVSLTETAKSIGGPSGRVLGIFGGIAGRNGFAAAQGVNPQLQIFGGKDPTAGDPYANGGGSTTGGYNNTTGGYNNTTGGYNNTTGGYNNTTGGMGGQSLLSSLAKLFSGMDDYEAEDDSDWMALTAKSNTPVALPPKPKGICGGKSGMSLVTCQRYVEALPTTEMLSGGTSRAQETKQSQSGGFSLTGGYSFYLIAKYGTAVQNQGTEGACTAFGNAHTIGAIAKAKGKPGEYDAWNIWRAQGQQMMLHSSLAAAKQMNFDGLRIVSARDIDAGVEIYKRIIDSGKPVYVGTDIDGSWHENTERLTCTGGKIGAHAYSIQGYDDASRKFIVKNSWGDSWGDQGFGYLSYDCIGNQGWSEAYDITLQ